MTDEVSDKLQALSTYIDGKIKRYNLIFAVNGGAFALAKLIKASAPENPLGNLTLTPLAIGAIAFTFLMWFDIWLWGEMMRNGYFHGEEVFQWRGKAILSLLASLLIIAWLLAVAELKITILAFGSLVIFGGMLAYHHSQEGKRKAHKSKSAP